MVVNQTLTKVFGAVCCTFLKTTRRIKEFIHISLSDAGSRHVGPAERSEHGFWAKIKVRLSATGHVLPLESAVTFMNQR